MCHADDGGEPSLPSVLADNPNIAEQWRTFLLATLLDFGSSSNHGSSGLSLARTAAAASYLLLQDRVDDAELLLRQFDLEHAAATLEEGAPLNMQVIAFWGFNEYQLFTSDTVHRQLPCGLTGARAANSGVCCCCKVDYLRAWMALCRPISASADNKAQVQSTLVLGKSVVELYKECASQVRCKLGCVKQLAGITRGSCS